MAQAIAHVAVNRRRGVVDAICQRICSTHLRLSVASSHRWTRETRYVYGLCNGPWIRAPSDPRSRSSLSSCRPPTL
jgi:hypothetical protein